MIIKVLGTGCANCKRTKALAKQVVEELNLDAQVEEVTDIAAIMGYGVISTPAIVIDEKVVGSGGAPSHSQMVNLLRLAQSSTL
jgi:small redox-active disulfide protein 2